MIRGFVYFALVFGAGFALGAIRVLWLVPRLGERTAELLEAPIMLCAILFSARSVVRRFPATVRLSYLASGILALSLLVLTEFTVVLWLRGLTLCEYFESRDPVSGSAYLTLLLVFALVPWAIGRKLAN